MTLKPDTLAAISLDEAAREGCGVQIDCCRCGRCKTISAATVLDKRPRWHFKRGPALKISCASCGAGPEDVTTQFVKLPKPQQSPTPQRAYG